MGTVIRTMDYGEGGPEYRIHFVVTYAGRPASGGDPAEGPECEITGIDGEKWDVTRADMPDTWIGMRWVPIEKAGLGKHEVEAVYGWSELLDLTDEIAEEIAAEREAYLEAKGDAQRDRLEAR